MGLAGEEGAMGGVEEGEGGAAVVSQLLVGTPDPRPMRPVALQGDVAVGDSQGKQGQNGRQNLRSHTVRPTSPAIRTRSHLPTSSVTQVLAIPLVSTTFSGC